jgi:hypothetical protein
MATQKEPEEAWEDKLDQWWLEHERAFAVPVAVTRDDVAIFIRSLFSQQRTQTIEEIKGIIKKAYKKNPEWGVHHCYYEDALKAVDSLK